MLTPMYRVAAVTAAALLSLASGGESSKAWAQQVDLRPKFAPGTSSKLVMSIKSTTRVKPSGGTAPVPAPTTPNGIKPGTKPSTNPGNGPGTAPTPDTSGQESDQEITFTEKVVDWNPESGGTIQLVYDRVKLKIKSDGLGEIDADTDGLPGAKPSAPAKPAAKDPFDNVIPIGPSRPPEPAPAKPAPGRPKDDLDQAIEAALKPDLTGVAGTVLTLKVDADGNITSVTGGERLAAGGLFGPGMTLPNSPEGLKGIFGPIRPQATPGKPGANPGMNPGMNPGFVNVGDKWATASEVVLAPTGPLTIKTNYELKSVRNGEAQISFNGKAESQSQGQSPGAPGAPLVKIPGASYRGNYTWDAKFGQLKRMESEQHTEAESPMGTMESDATIRVERKGSSAAAPGRMKPQLR